MLSSFKRFLPMILSIILRISDLQSLGFMYLSVKGGQTMRMIDLIGG